MPKSNLEQAEEIQDLLISKGFTWDNHEQAREKVLEEINELFQEINAPVTNRDRLEDEFGDCLFSLINLACRLNLNSEKCLGIAISKFQKRINHVEDQAKENGLTLKDVTLEQMLQWWKEAKK